MSYKEGDEVQVQLGPNIETARITKTSGKNRVTIVTAAGNTLDVDVSKLILTSKTEEPTPVSSLPSASEIAAAFAVPSLDREVLDEEASAFVLSDEWYGQLERGNPFYEAAEPYIKANPGLVFRYLGDPTVKRHGKRGYEPVIDQRTKLPVTVSGMTLARIPRHVHEERVRGVNRLTDGQDAKLQSAIAEQVGEAGKEAGMGAQMLDVFETAQTLRDGLPGTEFRPKS